jgi:hypothetical protein
MANEVFISYSRKDFTIVDVVKKEIDSSVGIDCWMDLNGIESGEYFKKVIISAINRHETLLFMLTPNSMASDFALKELNFAIKKEKRVILVDLAHTQLNDEFLFDYSDKDNIDWNDPLQHDKLLDNLKVWYGVDVDGERSKLSLTKALMKFPNEPVLIDDLFYQKSYDKLGLVIIKIDEKCSKEVIVPEYVTYHSFSFPVVGIENSFCNCTSIRSVIISKNIKDIEDKAFWDCKSLSSIIIPNNVNAIGNYAFWGCLSLVSVDIPNSVISIGDSAFENCSSLVSITIPKNISYFGNSVFDGCTSLSSILVEKSNPIYDSRNNCNAIIETATNTLIAGCKNTIIPNDITKIGNSAFSGCYSLCSILIPDGIKEIGADAFSYCKSLESIIIPSGVTSIGAYVFVGCLLLSSIVIDEINENYDSRNNCNAIIETATNTLIAGCKNTVIPNDVVNIGEAAFESCVSMLSIIIPNSIKKIGESAFWGCNTLENIQFKGTIAAWEAIKKEEDWNYGVPAIVVHCTDGDVEI